MSSWDAMSQTAYSTSLPVSLRISSAAAARFSALREQIITRAPSLTNSLAIALPIGVISAGFGFAELLQRLGVERRLHTAGDKKSMLDPFQAEKPKDVARLKGIQKELHETFQELVRKRRGPRLKRGDKTLFSGEFWTGAKAVELGLIDGIGELRQTLRARYGDKVALKRVDGPRPWWRRRLGFAGPPAGPSGPEDWVAGLLAAVEERAHWSRFGL